MRAYDTRVPSRTASCHQPSRVSHPHAALRAADTPDGDAQRAPASEARRKNACGCCPEGSLGNTRIALHPKLDAREQKRRKAKKRRYTIRRHLWDLSRIERVRKCGRVTVNPAGTVGLRISDGAAGYSGLATCGSVWSCPVCAAKIAASRSDELAEVLNWAESDGHTVAMLTLTLQHRKGNGLKALWDTIGKSWASVTSGKKWQRIKADFGLIGWARAVEITHGQNGWHPHIHVILVLEGEQTTACVEALGELIWPRWYRSLQRRGYTATRAHGLDIRTSENTVRDHLAAYFTKALACEATYGQLKEGKRGGRTPFEILADVVKHGLVDDLELWHEYEKVARGRRQLTWSRDLRAMAGLMDEQTDQEIAETDLGDADLLLIPSESWPSVRDDQVLLLLAAERGGITAARQWLDQRGIPWDNPPLRT